MERAWKDLSQFVILSQHLLGYTEKNQEKLNNGGRSPELKPGYPTYKAGTLSIY
jgi:hypothetical protein